MAAADEEHLSEPGSASGRRRGAAHAVWLCLVATAALAAPPWLAAMLWPLVAVGLVRVHRTALSWFAAILLLAAWFPMLRSAVVERQLHRPAELLEQVRDGYAEAVREVDEAAKTAAPMVELPNQSLALFRQLEALRSTVGADGALTLLVVDPNGRAVAWAGAGLRHELDQRALPRAGIDFVNGFTAATLVSVVPIDDASRPWRLVAGRSFSTLDVPFVDLSRVDVQQAVPAPEWTLVESATAAEESTGAAAKPGQSSEWANVTVAEGPNLRLRRSWLAAVSRSRLTLWPGVMFLLGCCWLLLLGSAASARNGPGLTFEPSLILPATAGTALLLWRAAMPTPVSLVASLGLALSLASFSGLLPEIRKRGLRVVGGAATSLGLMAVGALTQADLGPLDLSRSLLVDAQGWTLRMGLFLLAAGAVVWLARRRESIRGGAAWGLSAGLFMIAAASVESWRLGAVLAVVGGALLANLELRIDQVGRVLVLIVGTAFLAAVCWHVTSSREVGRQQLRELEAVAVSGLTELETGAFGDEIGDHFRALDLERVALGPPHRQRESQDLALALWLGSPMASHRALSALVVTPLAGPSSSFSYGLPVDVDTGDLAEDPRRWPVSELAAEWARNAFAGTAPLLSGGHVWGELRFWYLPLLADPEEHLGRRLELDPSALTRDLLAGRGGGLAVMQLPNGARLELTDDPTTPPRVGSSAPVSLPDGTALRRAGPSRFLPDSRLYVAVLIPRHLAIGSLRRCSVHALAVILALLALLAIGSGAGLANRRLRSDMARWLSSYPRQLVVVFLALLVLPLGLLTAFLLRSFEQSLEAQQRANGEAALESAVRIISTYLPTLDAGFSIETELDDALFNWLAQVVEHDVNLYWRGSVYSSSRPELFTAGILPRRIPGEVFSRLESRSRETVPRVNRVGAELSYLELYRPVTLAGEGAASNLILSVPLLAQQDAVSQTLARFTQQALIAAFVLLGLLLAVAARLAESFTTPLTEIVRGTSRIADGAVALGLEPREPELAALVEAIDDMARRIAEGRERLIQEKSVVEGVVANITSAVISVGRDRRVQMCNRMATELLGAQIGDRLDDLALRGLPEPIADLLNRQPNAPTRRTARFPDTEGEDQQWTVVWLPVPGDRDPAALVVVEDVTEVLRAQRLEAWAEMARMIAHEIKNPLTPIRLSAEHLRRVWEEAPERLNEVIEQCIGNILDQVSELRRTAAEFSAYSRIPSAEPAPGDLVEVVRGVVEAYRASPPRALQIELGGEAGPLKLRFDARLISRAVRNLLENALNASSSTGQIEVRVERRAEWAVIVVADRGGGVAEELLPKIFEPNFSTTSGGTGLGLPITLRIAEQHGGWVDARNRPGGGLEVTVALPLAKAS